MDPKNAVSRPSAAAEMAEAKARQAALLRVERIAQIGSWEVDLLQDRVTYSDEALRIHGLAREQFDGTLAAAIDLAHPEDRRRLMAAIHATLYEGKPFAIDYRILRPDGSLRHVHVEDEVVRDENGVPLRAFGITQDITERKKAELALSASEERFRTIYDHLPFGVFTMDSDGAVNSANASLVRMLGYESHAETLSAADVTANVYVDPAERRRFRQQLSARGIVRGFETQWRREDGSVLWVALSARIVPEAVRGDFGYVGLVEDITERKRLQQALREREETLRAIIDSSIDGIVTVGRDGRIVEFNPAAESIFGYARGEAVGTPLAERIVPPRLREAHHRGFERHLAGGEARIVGKRIETHAMRADGSEFPVELIIAPLAPSGELRFAGFLRDITARKLADDALKAERQRLGLVTDNVPAMIAYIDAGCCYRYANLRYRTFYSGSDAPIDGKPVAEVLTPESWQLARPRIEEALGGEPVSYTAERRLHDGRARHVSVSLVPHRDEAGAVLGIYVLAIDITAEHQAEAALRESEAGLRHAQEIARLSHIVVRPDGSFERWSEGLPVLIGCPANDVPGSTREWLALLHPEDRESFRSSAIEAARSRQRSTTEYRVRRRDGGLIHIRQTREPIGAPAADGRSRWIVTMQDITEQKHAEERIRRLNRVYAVLSGINSAIIRIRERSELLTEACRIAVEAGGFVLAWAGSVDREAGVVRPVGWAGASARDYLDTVPRVVFETKPGGAGLVGRALLEQKAVISNDIASDARLLTRAQCIQRGVNSLAVLPIVVGDEAVGVLTLLAAETGFFDEQELALLRELASDLAFALDYLAKADKVNYLAYYDALTGLANPALLLDRTAQYLSHASVRAEGAALVLIDVQRFRNVHDTLGRHGSDEVLRAIAQRLTACLAEESSPARVGPDVFAFLAKNVASDREVMEVAAGAIRACFAAPIRVDGNELRLAGRMGVALFPTDATTADALYRNAEAALAKAKKEGEECLFYSRDMTARVAEKLALETRLRHALEAGEFVLHYQPKISTRTGKVTSVEALIRWSSPEGTLVPPADFIPLLEETGLILPVGEWALQQAVRQYRAWRARGLAAPRIAVNVSALQLRSKDFVSVLRRAVAGAPEDEHGLDLEITESVIMSNIEDNIDKLTAARRMGMRIFIDDFGTGHSSLRYIARLPLDALKIDRSFVTAMTNSPQDMTIVSSILALGRDLSLKVVAEGVESDDQAKLLRLLKSDEMQGFLFSRPLPAEGVAVLLGEPRPAGPTT